MVIAVHPVQSEPRNRQPAQAPVAVTMAAYEVYCVVFAPQEDLITGSCRGGFGVGELVALLYARAFPREEWRRRFDEAITGLNI